MLKSADPMLCIAPFLCIYLFAQQCSVYPPKQAFLRHKDTLLPLHDKPGVSVHTVDSMFYNYRVNISPFKRYFVTLVFISWIKYCVVLYWLSLALASPSLSHNTWRVVEGPEQGYFEAKCSVVLCLFVAKFPSFLPKTIES